MKRNYSGLVRPWFAALFLVWFAGAATAANFTALDGTPRDINDYLGKKQWVVMVLWASDCHICNEEAPTLSAFHERRKDHNAIVLGVSLDGPEGLKDSQAFMQRHGVTFDSLATDFVSGSGYYTKLTGRRWIGTPTFMVFDPQGTLRAQQVGAIEVDIIEQFIDSN